MDITVYDRNLLGLGVVDVYKCLIWVRRYFQNGTFELTAKANRKNLFFLQKYNILQIDDDEVGYINSLSISRSKEEGTIFKASGLFYSGILSQRVILSNASNLKDLITLNARNVPNFIIDTALPNILIDNDVTGKNLGEVIEALARRDNFGYKAVLGADKKLTFKVFYGVDRSEAQTVNPQVTFSQEYENLLSSEYTNQDSGSVNTVYAHCKCPAGIEPCTPPQYSIIGGTDFDRIEKYIEVDAVTYDRQVAIGDGTVTKTYLDYAATLAEMTAQAKAEIVPVQENFQGTVNFKYKYKTDYDLGDVVTIFNDEWGKSTHQRITEVTEVYDNTSNSITPTFGNPARTVLDILKKVK